MNRFSIRKMTSLGHDSDRQNLDATGKNSIIWVRDAWDGVLYACRYLGEVRSATDFSVSRAARTVSSPNDAVFSIPDKKCARATARAQS